MAQQWEKELRAAIRGSCGRGWTARAGGQDTTQLIFRQPEPFERAWTVQPKPKQVTATISLAWHINNKDQILVAARDTARIASKGASIKEAALLACGPTPLGPALDWMALIDRYGDHRTRFTGQISARTWSRMHLSALTKWSELVTGPDAPTNAKAALVRFSWGKPGSDGRKRKVETICNFLEWACTTGLLDSEWVPPKDKKELVGKKQKTDVTRITGALSDLEIQRILNDTTKLHWWWAFSAMALYGLRPEEVVHLQMRGDELWCNYSKRNSHGMTKPRRLYALEPFEGLEKRWLKHWEAQYRVGSPGTELEFAL